MVGRADVDRDIQLRAMVLDAKAHILEPAAELRLGGDAAVDEVLARVDADDPAPGAGADERTQAHELEGMAEEVVVRVALRRVGKLATEVSLCHCRSGNFMVKVRHFEANERITIRSNFMGFALRCRSLFGRRLICTEMSKLVRKAPNSQFEFRADGY